jgi:hypothetical protein
VLRKLLEGFVFGVGFSLAFILVAVFVTPQLMPISFRSSDRPSPVGGQGISSAPRPEQPQFHELSVEEQIKQASAIALARYERSPDGKMKAVIREFLKKDPNTVIHYKAGDEYASASFYPSEGKDYGEGVVVFFVGSPASMRLSMTYSGDRIRGLADIPVELFRKKCEAPNA